MNQIINKFKKHDIVKFYSNYHQDYFFGEVIGIDKLRDSSIVAFTWNTQYIKNEDLKISNYSEYLKKEKAL